jgi:hypothetical protein
MEAPAATGMAAMLKRRKQQGGMNGGSSSNKECKAVWLCGTKRTQDQMHMEETKLDGSSNKAQTSWAAFTDKRDANKQGVNDARTIGPVLCQTATTTGNDECPMDWSANSG